MATAATNATLQDPYQRNYLGLKLDHCGFNAVTPVKFEANCLQFQYIKGGGHVMTIDLPQPPIGTKSPTLITRPGVVTDEQLAGYQQQMLIQPLAAPIPGPIKYDPARPPIWNETRPVGTWQYIMIPAQAGGSVNLTNCVGADQWQRLLELGFRPKLCKGSRYSLKVSSYGYDTPAMQAIASKYTGLAAVPSIPSFNNVGIGLNATNFFLTAQTQSKAQHKRLATDFVCQYSTYPFPANPATLPPIADDYSSALDILMDKPRGGWDTLAHGDAIVFMFCQYAPVTSDGGVETACIMQLPMTLTIHDKTTFSVLREIGSNDISQLSSLPVLNNVE